MKLFLVNIDEVLKIVDKSTIEKVYSSEKRNIEHNIGRFITRLIASKIFNVDNTEIITNNKKPCFKYLDLQFSISHSDNIIGVLFSGNDENKEIGLDIEKFKIRNLNKLSNYFKTEFKTQDDFYKFWTLYEANFKSRLDDNDNKNELSLKYNDYYISASYFGKQDFSFYNLTIINEDMIEFDKLGDSSFNKLDLILNEIKDFVIL